MPTIEQASRAFNALPDLTEDELQRALSAAKLTLSPKRRDVMFDALASAFQTYLRLTLAETWKSRAGPTAAKLKQIAGALKRAEEALGVMVIDGAIFRLKDDQLTAHLALQANWMAPRPNGWPDTSPPSRYWTRDDSEADYRETVEYQGHYKVSQCLEGLTLLRQFAEGAHSFQRKKVTPVGKKERNKGDRQMKALIESINDAWTQAFDKDPTVSWDGKDDKAAGPYVRFVWTVFHALADRVPSELANEHPRLKQGLSLSENAIRTRFKRSTVSRIKAFVRRG